MTQQEKLLLLKDLCARLPYGVICHTEAGNGHLCSINQTIFGTEYGVNISPLTRDYFNDSEQDEVIVKPYLRPMSSMTEEEKEIYSSFAVAYGNSRTIMIPSPIAMDYLLSHNFDVRGLIPRGLALEAPTDMYKTE